MIQMKAKDNADVLAIVSARGRSKGLPRKNIRAFCGSPLIEWSIRVARNAACVDRVVVSSEDAEIIEVAIRAGAEAPFVRPEALAGDDVAGVEPVIHAVEWLREHEGYQAPWILLLQPTSPLRTAGDIDEAYRLAISTGADAVMGVTPARTHPYWTKTMDEAGRLSDFIPIEHKSNTRQELPPVHVINGAIYLIRTGELLKTRSFGSGHLVAYCMPFARSIDIDDLLDFQIAEMIMRDSPVTD